MKEKHRTDQSKPS